MAKNKARFDELFDAKGMSARITLYAANMLDDTLRKMELRKATVNDQSMTKEYLLSALICYFSELSADEQKEKLGKGVAIMIRHAKVKDGGGWELAEPTPEVQSAPKSTVPGLTKIRSNNTKERTRKRGSN
jgi:hypothetical protein